VLLTSGKHYAPGPARERIGGWEFLRTPMPTGFVARLPWLRELKIVSDLDRRLDDVIGEVRPGILHAHSPALNALSAIRAGCRHRVPVVYEMRSLWGGMCNTAPNGSLLEDLAKQRDLPVCRAPPVEALRVGAGCGTGGQGSEEIAGCRSESVGGGSCTMRPASGAAMISVMPSMSETITGVPQAMLSSRTLGQPSCVETSSSKSAALWISGRR
jgi:hypothetical protein